MAKNHREYSSKYVSSELSIKFGRKLYLGVILWPKSGKNLVKTVKLQSNTFTSKFGRFNFNENGYKSQGM